MEGQMIDNTETGNNIQPANAGKRVNDTRTGSGVGKWLVLIIVLVVVALLAALWATYTFYPTYIQPYFPFGHVPPPLQNVAGDYQFYYVAKTVVSTINIALLTFLLITYTSIYVKTRSQFSIGLVVFSIVFLIKDLTASPLVIWAFHYILVGLGPFALIPDLFEFVALMVLLYLSVSY